MVVYCQICGTQLDDGVSFCKNCGAVIQQNRQASQNFQQPVQQPVNQQNPSQHNSYYPQQIPPQNKSNKMIVVAVVAIVAIALIGFLLYFFVIDGNMLNNEEDGSDNNGGVNTNSVVGTWEAATGTTMNYSYSMTFKSDGTISMNAMGSSMDLGTWKIQNNKLCLEVSYDSSYDNSNSQCYDYSLSNNGNTLTLSSNNYDTTVMTRKN